MPRNANPEAPYEILKLLGKGTFGQVWLARRCGSQELCAIKRIVKVDENIVSRELEVMEALRNRPFCVQVQEVFFTKEGDRLYNHIVMKYYPDNLENEIRRRRGESRPFTKTEVRSYAWQIFQGLKVLRDAGVMHRDLKPENILVDGKGGLVFSDFGCSKFFGEDANSTPFMGSQYYRAPELLFASDHYGPEVDIWSAACIILELTTLEPVLKGEDKSERIFPILRLAGPIPTRILNNLRRERPTMKDWVAWVARLQATLPSDSGLLRKLSSFFDSKGVAEDFFRRIFVYEAGGDSVRLSVEEALAHPFFQGFGEPADPPRKRGQSVSRSVSCPLKPK